MAVKYDRNKLLFDPRYEAFPRWRKCSKCKTRKEKYEFHVSLIGTYKRTGEPNYRINAWCRKCAGDQQKASRKHVLKPGRRVPTAPYLDKLLTLYGSERTLADLNETVGLALGTVATIFQRANLRHSNGVKIDRAYDALCERSTPEQRAEWHEIGRQRREKSQTARLIRATTTDAVRVCLVCRKGKPNTDKHFHPKYQPNTCKPCVVEKRREYDDADPERVRLHITDDHRKLVRSVLDGFTKRELTERGIWNSSYDRLLSGQSTYITPLTLKKYEDAAAELDSRVEAL